MEKILKEWNEKFRWKCLEPDLLSQNKYFTDKSSKNHKYMQSNDYYKHFDFTIHSMKNQLDKRLHKSHESLL